MATQTAPTQALIVNSNDTKSSMTAKLDDQLIAIRLHMKEKFYSTKAVETLSLKQCDVNKEQKTQKSVHFPESAPLGVGDNSSRPISVPKSKDERSDQSAHKSPSYATINNTHMWPSGTTLIAGDSMIGGIFENKIGPRNTIKVRSFPGAQVDDMYDYLRPLLKKKPSRVILHIGTNDAIKSNAKLIADKIILLKKFVHSQIDGCSVYISSPINRLDSVNQGVVIRNVNVILRNMTDINLVDNNNITEKHLGRKKLYLNSNGSTMLARNFLTILRRI